jgi:hypothetical protein
MFRRVAAAFRYAMREEGFGPALGAGVTVLALGTLTTTSVSDPDLVLQDGWVKIFTVLLQLIGIGILVEILRRLGTGFVAVQSEDRPG